MSDIAGSMDSALAAPAPAGYHVNTQNPQVKGLELGLWVGVAGLVISTIFSMMRVYTRALLARIFGIEDACMLLSWASATSVQALIICE